MERKIGEIFEYNGEWHQCVEQPEKYDKTVCAICAFQGNGNCELDRCSGTYRSDKKFVIFKKLEKVGEPYMTGNKLIQRYKIYPTTCCINVYGWYYQNLDVKSWTIDIEIKQTKEDMEENGNNRTNCAQCGDKRFEVIARAKAHLLEATNIASDEKEMAVIDNILFRFYQMGWLERYEEETKELNLKPFDIQKAKDGKTVCTRDGHKARIICFDRVDAKPILALIASTDGKGEDVFDYFVSGKRIANALESDLDLMMLPEKKEGWVNVYYDNDASSHRGCRYIYDTKEEAIKGAGASYIATIKISWEE